MPASANRYAYGLGNPLRYADPTGHTAAALVNWAADNPGETAQLVVSFALPWAWGATAVVSGIVGYDVWSGRALSDGERLAYGALGAVAIVASVHLPSALEADVARLGQGASRLERAAGEARLGGALREGGAAARVGGEANAAAGAIGGEVRGAKFADYMGAVEKLDVSTAPGRAVFYSGKGTRAVAEELAIREGRTTIEMTAGGRWLESQQLFGPRSPLTTEQATAVWSRLSERFAEQASGTVIAMVRNPRPGAIFEVEWQALLRNPSVKNVISGF